MKILIQILVIFISANFVLLTQTNNDNFLNINHNSAKIKPAQQNIEQMITRFDEFELYSSLNNFRRQLPLDVDSNTIWLRTSIIISKEEILDKKLSPHFLEPLELKYYRDSEFNFIRYALGMAQAGAVGYLAYKHIKKYGLFK